MKKFLFTALICIITAHAFASSKIKKSKTKNKEQYEKRAEATEADDDSRKRTEWEFERLKDPATGKIPDNIREKELAFAATIPGDASYGQLKSANAIGWTSRGPFNVGGRTRAFAYDMNDENILFSGAVSGGMWRSTDAGYSWTKVSALNNNQSVTCIAQDKRASKRNIWYYGSGEAYGASASGGKAFHLGSGVFKSSDSGLTWTKLSSTGASTPQTFDNVWDLVWNVATDSSNAT